MIWNPGIITWAYIIPLFGHPRLELGHTTFSAWTKTRIFGDTCSWSANICWAEVLILEISSLKAGGTGVMVGGTGVAFGRRGVTVGGIGVAVSGIGVAVFSVGVVFWVVSLLKFPLHQRVHMRTTINPRRFTRNICSLPFVMLVIPGVGICRDIILDSLRGMTENQSRTFSNNHDCNCFK